MSRLHKVGSLEIDDDLSFDRRQSRVQRVAWFLMLALVLAALTGLLGGGGLSRATAGHEDGALGLEYERFQRHGKSTRLTLSLGPAPGAAESVSVWLDRGFLERYKLEAVMPEPESQALSGDRVAFRFARQSPERPTRIVFDLLPERAGARPGRAGIEGGPELHFRPFVYP